MTAKSSNQAKAPEAAKFVEEMREVFGADQVKVTYVREGNFELGDPPDYLAVSRDEPRDEDKAAALVSPGSVG
jgi:hypothetical protein